MGEENATWLTPFKKQCFVVLGVCLNTSAHGIVMGFAAILLPQLRRAGSPIPLDDSSGSWIASIVGISPIAGNFVVPTIMTKYGHRTAYLISILPLIVGWFCILTASSITTLLIARFIQGISMGMSASLGPVLIGEYTSPKNRGAFLTLISLSIGIGVLVVHTIGSYFSWQITALVCAFIAFIDLLIVIYSPESPSFFIDQGRYEKSKKIFRWLRGDGEEEELQRMIETAIIVREAKNKVDLNKRFARKVHAYIVYFNSTVRKKEFYKPILIMIHLYLICQWGGASLVSTYIVDVVENVIGRDVNIALMVVVLDIQRIVSNACAVYFIKTVKRRTMLLVTVSLNIFAFLSTAVYVYLKSQSLLPFDHPFIGIALIHIHMFSIATGTIPLPFIISGELFPLEYRALAGGISVLFLSLNLFVNVKIVPFLFNNIKIYGAYILYAAVVGYSLIFCMKFLPETKDRTLQDIEDEFRGGPLSAEEMKSMESLTSGKLHSCDRRCSSPVL